MSAAHEVRGARRSALEVPERRRQGRVADALDRGAQRRQRRGGLAEDGLRKDLGKGGEALAEAGMV